MADGTALRYPGVRVRNSGAHDIPPQTVTATLPAGAGMHFGTPSSPDHQLTIKVAGQSDYVHDGMPSGDGQTLTFTDIDLAVPGNGSEATLYVCVSASPSTPLGATTVEFTIGDKTSPSTTLDIV
ncbi:hypothetical protein [Streptomyces coeruleorubidus]|uniref:hypothetical protein n=1 Tax=Streptomyces coeruleorubidus TaxID=116188 RepID=UPI0036647F8D